MTIRVTNEEVLQIITTDITDCTPFIMAANTIVDKYLGETSDLSNKQKKEIERWLSAHFLAIKDPQIKSESVGGASASYQVGTLGKGLDSTMWGQMALTLDTTGILKESSSTKRASVKAIDLGL